MWSAFNLPGYPRCAYRSCLKPGHRLLPVGIAAIHCKERSSEGDLFTQRDQFHEWHTRAGYFGMEPEENLQFPAAGKDQVVFQSPFWRSHFGGIWERYIRTVKILRSLLKEKITDDESLSTLICAVESILNSHPISTLSSDPRDLEPLTPKHLLLLKGEVPYFGRNIYFQDVVGDKYSTSSMHF